MANIQRIQIPSSGFIGGPGVTTFYALDAAAALPELKGLMAGFAALQTSNLHYEYPTVGDIIDPINGDLVGSWTAGGRAGDTGGDSAVYSAPSGMCVNWLTGDVLDGHRLKGRSFFVPMSSNVYQDDGSIAPSILSSFQSLADAKVSSMAANFVVWHRPKKDKITHAITRDGGYSVVTSAHVPDRAIVLRSRRG